MIEAGFEYIAPGAFYNEAEGVLASDVYPKNVKFSGGIAVPIDPVLQRTTPEFAGFIKNNYQYLPDFQNIEAGEWHNAVEPGSGF